MWAHKFEMKLRKKGTDVFVSAVSLLLLLAAAAAAAAVDAAGKNVYTKRKIL